MGKLESEDNVLKTLARILVIALMAALLMPLALSEGSEWVYGISYSGSTAYYNLCRMDDRGYLAPAESGWYYRYVFDTYDEPSARALRAWQLPDGTVFTEAKAKIGKSYFGNWQLLSAEGKSFDLLARVEYPGKGDISALEASLTATFDGMSFASNGDINLPSVNAGEGWVLIAAYDKGKLPQMKELIKAAEENFIPEEETAETPVSLAVQDAKAQGVALKAAGSYTYETEIRESYLTEHGTKVTFYVNPADGSISKVVIDDSDRYPFKLYRSSAEIAALEVTADMTVLMNAFVRSAALSIPEEERVTLSRYEMQIDSTEDSPARYAIYGGVKTAHAQLEMRKSLHRAGQEYFSSTLTITVKSAGRLSSRTSHAVARPGRMK